MTLQAFLAQHGFPMPGKLDGLYYRFDRTKPQSGWFRGMEHEVRGRKIVLAWFGDWATGEKYDFRGGDEDLSPEERAALDEALRAQEEARALAKEADQLQVAEEAARQFAKGIPLGATPYLQKKNIPSLFGAKIDPDRVDTLWVPVSDLSGKIWSLQVIGPDGQKRFLPGGRLRGLMHILQWPPLHEVIYVAEGFATAASLALADPSGASVCCFNAGNLERVVLELRAHYGEARIVLCADNDAWTRKPDGSPWNPGIEKAKQALGVLGGNSELRFPVFGVLPDDRRPTDFNDLHALQGVDAVRTQLAGPPPELPSGGGSGAGDPGPGAPPAIERVTPSHELGFLEGIPPVPLRVNQRGQPVAPTQQKVVDHLLRHLDQILVKQGRDIFRYTGTHWKLFTDGEHDKLKVLIQTTCSGLADVRFIDSAYKLLLYHLPSPPEEFNLFMSNPFCANFLNGTLHAVKAVPGQRAWGLEFRPHSKGDFLVNVLPLEYRPGDLEENPEFTAMLGRVFEGDPDREQKIRAVAQMYGAMLMPIYPHLFMLWGPPGTGKSTVLNIGARLVHASNLSSVSPTDFQGFNMETMAGKLVNLDTDIAFDTPMRDEVVKKIIDRRPFRVRRKNKVDLYVPLPAIHAFGGNDLPKALDGVSKAHDRRWSFIGFNAFVPKGSYDRDYWDYCFELGPQGILNFALAGLQDLLQGGGHFLNPDSGKEKLRTWQMKSDIVGQFLEDVKDDMVADGNTQVMLGEDRRISRPNLWAIFQKWHQEALCRPSTLGRNVFFDTLRAKKFSESRTRAGRYVLGIGSEVTDFAKF